MRATVIAIVGVVLLALLLAALDITGILKTDIGGLCVNGQSIETSAGDMLQSKYPYDHCKSIAAKKAARQKGDHTGE